MNIKTTRIKKLAILVILFSSSGVTADLNFAVDSVEGGPGEVNLCIVVLFAFLIQLLMIVSFLC